MAMENVSPPKLYGKHFTLPRMTPKKTIPEKLKARLKLLPECHKSYFVVDANTVLVAVDRLELTRLRWQGAINANELMRRAAEGEIERAAADLGTSARRRQFRCS